MNNIDFTILILSWNQSPILSNSIISAKKTIQHFQTLGLVGEILVCQDLSSKTTPTLLVGEDYQVIQCNQKGYGNALRLGSEQAHGTIIVSSQADNSYDLEEAIPMIQLLRNGYQFCLGSRIKGKILAKALSGKDRWIVIPVVSTIINFCFRTNFSDTHCRLRAYTKDAFLSMKLRATGLEITTEMLIRSKELNLRSIELPVSFHPAIGQSTLGLRSWENILQEIILIFKKLINYCR